MKTSFKIQYFIAFILTFAMVILSYFRLSNESINFWDLSNEQKIFYVSIVLDCIFLSLAVIYSILYCFWSTLTCCWRGENNSPIEFSCWKGFFFLAFILANAFIFYSLYLNPVILPEVLSYLGNAFLIYILVIIGEGVLFSLIRCYINRPKKKRLLPTNEKQDFSDIV